MYAVIEEASIAPTAVMLRKIAAQCGLPADEKARAKLSPEYLARGEASYARARQGIESRLRRANVGETVRAWIGHVSRLAAKIANGWRPRLNDLTPVEWQGLDLWRAAGQRFADSHVKCPGCGRAIPRGQSADACGWKEEGK